jgi:predicted metal-dependent phosphoesterase TrpH
MPEVRSLWALMTTKRSEDAVRQLAERENVRAHIDRDIGRWKIGEPCRNPKLHTISAWAMKQQLEALVWTALGHKIKKEKDRISSLEEILARLRKAEAKGLTKPREYIEKAPRQIDTNFRRAINKELGWSCRSEI